LPAFSIKEYWPHIGDLFEYPKKLAILKQRHSFTLVLMWRFDRKLICASSFWIIPFLFSTISAWGQRIENPKALIIEDNVVVSYDLVGTKSDQSFEVHLYSSANQFLSPLTKVTGDVGKNIAPGVGKQIMWDPTAELVKFRGEVTFEVRVTVFTPFVSFQSPQAGAGLKRGKINSIQWSGGDPQVKLQLELYHEGAKVGTIETTDNIGRFSWNTPLQTKPAKNYQIRIANEADDSEFAFSPKFSIKPKTPIALKLLPVLVVGGVAALLLSGDSGEPPPTGGNGGGGDEPIPDPPGPN